MVKKLLNLDSGVTQGLKQVGQGSLEMSSFFLSIFGAEKKDFHQ